jgi:hypothetical protein
MQSPSLASIVTLLLALGGVVISDAMAQGAKHAQFIETYEANAQGGLKMRLQLLKPLASLPATGWLNSADEAMADGKFGGSVKKPFQMTTKPDFVVLEAEKRGPVSGGRYIVENGVLTICMLSLAPGAYRNVLEMAAPENYTLCAAMQLKGA